MLQGERLDQIRDLAWRELELAEEEEVLTEGTEVARHLEVARERRPSGMPLRAITAEHEIPAA